MAGLLNLNTIRSLNGLGGMVHSDNFVIPENPLLGYENAISMSAGRGPMGHGCSNELKNNQMDMELGTNALSKGFAEAAASMGWAGDDHMELILGAGAALALLWFVKGKR